jgi:hypothetical protein
MFAESMMLNQSIAELIPNQGNMVRRQGVGDLMGELDGWGRVGLIGRKFAKSVS